MQTLVFPAAGDPGLVRALALWMGHWHRPPVLRGCLISLLIGALFAGVGAIVYATGGTRLAYAHLFYVPILLSGFCFGLPGGLVGGVAAGLIAGPWMPLDVAGNLPQSTLNWLSRMGYFTLSGGLAGVLCSLLRGQIEAVRRYGHYDPLTGLPNTAALRLAITEALEHPREQQLALLRLQIASFEDVNTAFGYRTADALLKSIAERLARVRPGGTRVYHLYAAQFGILCRGADERGAIAIAQGLMTSLKEPFLVDGIPIVAEGRWGYARYPAHATEPHGLLRAASFALHEAETTVQDAIRTYDPQRHHQHKRALRLVADLRKGIDEGQFTLLYQPKVDMRSGVCVGVEALARWRHPSHGAISPGLFTSIAERTTIIKAFTAWLAESALEQLASWRAVGLELGMAINVSVRNLEDPEFPALLRGLMERHAIPPGSLEIEVTESAVMMQTQRALDALQRLKELDVRIAIDDFGTGQSSLAYLKELPADSIKIDQAFVRDLTDQPKHRKIVRAAIDLAHDMDLTVVAEGVESSEAFEYLRTFACDAAQGYFISPPLDAAGLIHWLETSRPTGSSSLDGAPTVCSQRGPANA